LQFPPPALGFFGLGAGYLIWGPQELLGFPARDDRVDLSLGVWGLGWNRYRGNDARPNAGMSVAFTVISALGVTVFFHAGDWPVGLLFIGLVAVYVSDFFIAVGGRVFERVLGLVHVVTGL